MSAVAERIQSLPIVRHVGNCRYTFAPDTSEADIAKVLAKAARLKAPKPYTVGSGGSVGPMSRLKEPSFAVLKAIQAGDLRVRQDCTQPDTVTDVEPDANPDQFVTLADASRAIGKPPEYFRLRKSRLKGEQFPNHAQVANGRILYRLGDLIEWDEWRKARPQAR